MGLLDGFGSLDTEFGGRSDVPTLDFGVVPVLPDEKDEYRKTDNEIQGALIEGSEIWTPAAEPGATRLRLATVPSLPGIGPAQSSGAVIFHLFRRASIENTTGFDATGNERSAVFEEFFYDALNSVWRVTSHGFTSATADLADTDQSATLELSSGEPGSVVGSGTDAYLRLAMSNTTVPTSGELWFRLIGGSPAAINPEGIAIAHSFRRGISGDDVLTTGVATVLDMDDTTNTGCHDDFPGAMSGTGTFTIPTGWGGKWEFFAGAQWASGTVGVRILQIQLNGGGVADDRKFPIGVTTHSISTGPIQVFAGDTVRVMAQHTQGVNLNVTDGDLTFFGGRYVGTV